MSSTHSPGNRARIEGVLGPDLCRAIAEQCQWWGVPLERWNRVPTFARSWEVTAVSMLAKQFEQSQGLGSKSAIDSAAIYLDLNPDTIHSRLKRATADAYRKAA